MEQSFSKYTNVSVADALGMVKSSPEGISKAEAEKRLEEFGFNEVPVKGLNALAILWRQMKSPFCYLVAIAAVISLFIGERIDSVAFFIFVFINIGFGFFQEYRAEKSLKLLKQFIPEKARVLRGDVKVFIDKKTLVVGDIVLLEAGDMIPADVRIIESQQIVVDESSLTGESSPVEKSNETLRSKEDDIFAAKNILFAGTPITSGSARGLVIATGKETVFGGIIKEVAGISRESAYEKSIRYFSRLILRIVGITLLLIFAINIFLKGFSSLFEISLFSLALLVSILPDALPVVVTFALSQGSVKLAKQKVVVKRLSAIEDLGNMEILCTDKTGTLTENKLTLEKAVSSDQKRLFLYGLLSFGESLKQEKMSNPFDAAIMKRTSREIVTQAKKWGNLFSLPFDSYRMRSSFLAVSARGEKILVVKGAPELLLHHCTKLTGKFKKPEILEDVARQGKEGKRVLALAYKKMPKDSRLLKASDEKGLTFLGYFVFNDPLKSSAKESIELAKKLGVQIKIITGDAKEVTEFVARKTGLLTGNDEAVSGEALAKMTKEEFEDACEHYSAFTRISPDVKFKIINALQKKFEVGYMGDGINDAPALKKADVGLAVVGASDIAREAADVVLLEKNLKVIINGIKDGREIFANVNKYIKTTLANNFGDFYSIATISLFINFLPILPVQIILGDILSDLPLISIATDSVDVAELRKPKMYQLHNVLPLIISLGLVSVVFDFIFYLVIRHQQVPVIQTLWFVETIFTEIFLIFIIRTAKKFWKAKRPSTLLLSLTIISGLLIIILPFIPLAQEWFHFAAPPILPLLTVFLLAIAYFAASEAVKLIYFKYWKSKEGS